MGIESDLLRMLEPAVRPSGLPSSATPRSAPIEGQSFEALLAAAREQSDADGHAATNDMESKPTSNTRRHDALSTLAGLDRVENASLQRLISGPDDHAA